MCRGGLGRGGGLPDPLVGWLVLVHVKFFASGFRGGGAAVGEGSSRFVRREALNFAPLAACGSCVRGSCVVRRDCAFLHVLILHSCRHIGNFQSEKCKNRFRESPLKTESCQILR